MLQEIERLLILQDRDRKIRALRQELKMAPLEQKELDARLVSATSQLDAAKLKAKENEVERKKLEVEAQSKRDQIAKYQTQKFQTRKNEEFQAISNEIARYEGEVQLIEDREIELMESAETLKKTLAETERTTTATKALVARQTEDVAAKIKALQDQLNELEAERNGIATGVEEDLLDTYQRLFLNKAEAVVPLEHDVCMGCHMKVIAQTAVNVRGRKELVHCENCGRILYAGES